LRFSRARGPVGLKNNRKLALVKQFDPSQIALGSALTLVESRLGKPHLTDSLDGGREMRYYGNIEFGLSASRELMWLSVVYEDGKVIRVFSRDFFDHDKIRPLEEKSLQKTDQ
jgi:hypothetical protein